MVSKDKLKLEDLNDLKEHLDRKLRKSSLDTALLFFSSSFGLLFSLISAFIGRSALISFLPTLFLGWAMPIYVGYLRGSLSLDLVEERARAWIYLTVGVGLYVTPLGTTLLFGNVTGWTGIILRVALNIIIPAVIGYQSRSLFLIILKIGGEKTTDKTERHFLATFFSAVYMVIGFSILNQIITEGNNLGWDIIIIALACLAIYDELVRARR